MTFRNCQLETATDVVKESRDFTKVLAKKKEVPGQDPITPRLLTLVQAARYSSFSYWTIRDLCLSGRLPRVQLPRSFSQARAKDGSTVRVPVNDGSSLRAIRIDRVDLDKLIDECKTHGGGLRL